MLVPVPSLGESLAAVAARVRARTSVDHHVVFDVAQLVEAHLADQTLQNLPEASSLTTTLLSHLEVLIFLEVSLSLFQLGLDSLVYRFHGNVSWLSQRLLFGFQFSWSLPGTWDVMHALLLVLLALFRDDVDFEHLGVRRAFPKAASEKIPKLGADPRGKFLVFIVGPPRVSQEVGFESLLAQG